MWLPDYQIAFLARQGLITPWHEPKRDADGISTGQGAHGYDCAIGVFQEWRSVNGYSTDVGYHRAITLGPGDCLTCYTQEYFRVPVNLRGRSTAKSYWQRRFLFVCDGNLQAGWEGHLLVEMKNISNQPITLQCGQGIVEVAFTLVEPAANSYLSQYHAQGCEERS